MKTTKNLTLLLSGMLIMLNLAWADDAAKPDTTNASVSGKNEIPVCEKLVPISVSLGAAFQNEDRIEVIEKYEVLKRLEYAIACELHHEGYSTTKPFDIKVSITNFRLRSGGTTVMFGVMAGIDKLGVNVSVASPEQTPPWQFEEHTTTVKGSVHKPTPSQRLNLMVQKIAKTVVEKIKKKGLLAKT